MPFREKKYHDRIFYGVGFDIIDYCNIKCTQCFYEKGSNSQRFISLEQMKMMIDKTAPYFGEIYLLGGEPTIHHDIVAITRYAAKKFHQVILVTNGVKLADADFCRALAHHKVSLAMQLRATSSRHEKLVDSLAGVDGVFKKQRKAWKNVLKYWPKSAEQNVQVNILRPLVSAGCIFEVFKFAREHGFTPVIEMAKSSKTFLRGCENDTPLDEVKELYQQLRAYDQKNFPKKRSYLTQTMSPPSYNHTCTLVETGVHINVDGKVLPCVGHAGIDVGNIYCDDVVNILSHPVLHAIRSYKQWIVGPCSKCRQFEKCHGGCRGEAFFATGCPRASDPYCFNIPAGTPMSAMVPKSCHGCVLQPYRKCSIKV
ncbi:MAG: radical SAM protein [Candidatus Parcubacteria bacterium]|nr:radical SAM protein [Candidatus Parcubacteria bacterium]